MPLTEEELKQIEKSAAVGAQTKIDEYVNTQEKKNEELVKTYIEKNKENEDGLATKADLTKVTEALNKSIEDNARGRAEAAYRAWSDDELNQGMKKVAGLHLIVKAHKMGAAITEKEANRANKEALELLKHIFPAMENRYAFDTSYQVNKAKFSTEYGFEFQDFNKSAMAAATSGAGLEWLAVQYGTGLIDFMHESTPVKGLFEFVTVPGGRLNRKRKTSIAGQGAKIYSVFGAAVTAENTANATTGNLGTGEVSWVTNRIDAYHEESYTLQLESVIDVMTEIEKEISLQIFQQVDNGLMNGAATTEGTVFTGAVADATNVVKKIDGLRFHALTNGSTVSHGSAFDFDDYRATRKSMGLYGDNQGNCVALFARGAFYGALDAIKLHSSVGAAASMISGKLGILDGVETMLGGFSMDTTATNSSGKFDITTEANNVKDSVVIVNKQAFKGIQSEDVRLFNSFEVKGSYYKFSGQYHFDFQCQDAVPSGHSPVGLSYNITQ
jgi:HK97 family phage major capsid protein